MFNIKIDEVLLSSLAQEDVKLEEFIIIACLIMGGHLPLRAYLSRRNPDQIHAYLQTLERKLLLKRLSDTEEFTWDNYELTEYADRLFETASANIIEDGSLIREMDPIESVPALVEEYLGLFPEGVRNAGGDYVRGNSPDVANKLAKFVKKYKFPKEVIIGATGNYIKQQAREQYKWCSSAHFFISKNGVSKLATECEAFKGMKEGSDDWRENLM